MRVWKKVAISLSVLVVAVPIIVAGMFVYTTNDMCGNEVYSEVLSPSSAHKVVVFKRDCGATTGLSTQVSIIGANDKLKNESGSIYITDGHPRGVSPDIKWLSSSELRIERSLNGSEHKVESEWGFMNKIDITYGVGGS